MHVLNMQSIVFHWSFLCIQACFLWFCFNQMFCVVVCFLACSQIIIFLLMLIMILLVISLQAGEAN